MKNFFKNITEIHLSNSIVHVALCIFRIIVSLELIVVHGFKKIGIGLSTPESVPNPFGMPENLNQTLAIVANIGFPIFIILGFLTRLATLPILAVTLTGYFILHVHDSLIIKDIPLMYSLCFLFLMIVGPGKYSIDQIIHKKLSK